MNDAIQMALAFAAAFVAVVFVSTLIAVIIHIAAAAASEFLIWLFDRLGW